jgi:hypothetical protein
MALADWLRRLAGLGDDRDEPGRSPPDPDDEPADDEDDDDDPGVYPMW